MTFVIKKAGFPLGETPPEQQNVERISKHYASSVFINCNAQSTTEVAHIDFKDSAGVLRVAAIDQRW